MAGAASAPGGLDLPPDAAAAASARRYVRERLHALGEHDGIVDAMCLAASELVTNAALHARTAITVDVVRARDGVRLTVSDGSPVLPEARQHTPTSTTGRGLQILAALGTTGVEPLPGGNGKLVWFEPGGAHERQSGRSS